MPATELTMDAPICCQELQPDADCCPPSALSIERLFSKATVEVCVGTPGSSLSLRLSRDEEGNVVGFSSALSTHEIRAVQTDSVISKVITLVLSTAEIWPNELADFRRYRNQLRLDNGILYYDRGTFNAYVVTFTLLVEVLLMVHHKLNHIGRQKLVELTSQHVWHPEMQKVAGDVCTSCHVCQTMKIMPTVTPPMMKIQTTRPFELVAVDLVLLPRSQQFIGCLVAIDHTTKWLMVHPIRNKTASHIAKIFEHRILPSCVKLPEKILSDNGGEFKSSLFQEVLERYNIKHIFTTANKPSSNGLVERVNRTLIEQLRIGQEDGGNSWVDRLAKVVRVYNGTYQTAIHCSPSQFILCKSHQSRDDLHLPAGAPETWSEGSSFFQTYDVGQEVLKKVILRGNEVLGKFQPRFEGPFTIIHANENGVTYQVEDGASGRILKVHHSQLRRYVRAPEYLLTNPYHRLLSSGKPVSHSEEDEVTPVALVAAMKMQSESESSTDESLEQASTSSESDQQDSTNQPILDSEDETETEVRNVRRSLATSSENWSRMATGGFSAARLLHLLGEESSEGEVECSCGQCESPRRKSKSTPVEELEEPVMLPVTPPVRNDVHTEEKNINTLDWDMVLPDSSENEADSIEVVKQRCLDILDEGCKGIGSMSNMMELALNLSNEVSVASGEDPVEVSPVLSKLVELQEAVSKVNQSLKRSAVREDSHSSALGDFKRNRPSTLRPLTVVSDNGSEDGPPRNITMMETPKRTFHGMVTRRRGSVPDLPNVQPRILEYVKE